MADEAKIQQLYLRTLSRLPTSDEQTIATQTLKNSPDQRRTLEDLTWALLNTPEFYFVH
jgi:hypothetical protein